jgi:hypothetical protein
MLMYIIIICFLSRVESTSDVSYIRLNTRTVLKLILEGTTYVIVKMCRYFIFRIYTLCIKSNPAIWTFCHEIREIAVPFPI